MQKKYPREIFRSIVESLEGINPEKNIKLWKLFDMDPKEGSALDKTFKKLWDISGTAVDDLAEEIKNLSDAEKQAILQSGTFSKSLKDLTQGLMAGGESAAVFTGILMDVLTARGFHNLKLKGGNVDVKLPDANKTKKLLNVWRAAAEAGAIISTAIAGFTIKGAIVSLCAKIKTGLAFALAAIKGFVAGLGGVKAGLILLGGVAAKIGIIVARTYCIT